MRKQNKDTNPGIRKIVINRCYGGFSLSHKAFVEYYRRKGITVYAYESPIRRTSSGERTPLRLLNDEEADKAFIVHYLSKKLPRVSDVEKIDEKYFLDRSGMKRDDPDLVAVVEDMGKDADGAYAELKVVEVPADAKWQIEEYDGMEWVAEVHRTWN